MSLSILEQMNTLLYIVFCCCVGLNICSYLIFSLFVWVHCHFVLTALKSHGNPDVRNDLVELKIKQDLPVS